MLPLCHHHQINYNIYYISYCIYCQIYFEILFFLLIIIRFYILSIKKSTQRVRVFELERVKRIELSQSAWKAEVLPLNYTRLLKKLHRSFCGPATSYSRTCVLPSALRSLTSVFGMGTGVPSLPSLLDHWRFG